MARWIPWVRRSTHQIEVRTTNLMGGEVRVIGRMDVPPAPQNADLPRMLRWMPDGKRLSFLYKDWLWTVPAE